MTTDGATTTAGRARALVGALRAGPEQAVRVHQLESEVAELRRRVEELERSAAVVNSVRDEVRALTESMTEQLNRLATDADRVRGS